MLDANNAEHGSHSALARTLGDRSWACRRDVGWRRQASPGVARQPGGGPNPRRGVRHLVADVLARCPHPVHATPSNPLQPPRSRYFLCSADAPSLRPSRTGLAGLRGEAVAGVQEVPGAMPAALVRSGRGAPSASPPFSRFVESCLHCCPRARRGRDLRAFSARWRGRQKARQRAGHNGLRPLQAPSAGSRAATRRHAKGRVLKRVPPRPARLSRSPAAPPQLYVTYAETLSFRALPGQVGEAVQRALLRQGQSLADAV